MRSRIAFFLGLIVAIIAGTALIGWQTHSELLRDIVPKGNSMVPTTGVGMLLYGLTLAAASLPLPRWARWLTTVFTAVVAGFGLLTLAEFLFDMDFGVRLWMFRESLSTESEAFVPGRMAASAALCFILAGIALAGAIWRDHQFPWLPSLRGLALTVALIGVALFLIHTTALVLPNMGLRYVDMALNTSLSFTLLGVGLLVLARQEGQPHWVIHPSIGITFIVAIILMAITLCTAYVSMMGLYQNSSHVRQREEALKEIEEVLSGLAMLQMTTHEYTHSRKQELLATRKELLGEIHFDLSETAELTADDPKWRGMVADVQNRIDQLLEIQTQMIESANGDPAPRASRRSTPEGVNQQIWQSVLQSIRQFRAYETDELHRTREKAEREAHRTFLLLPVGFFISLAILLVNICYLNLAWSRQLSAETRKTAVMNVSLDAIVTMDESCRVVDFNPAAERLFGISAAKAQKQDLAHLAFPSKQREQVQNLLEANRHHRSHPLLGRQFETVAQRADGTQFPVEMVIQPVRKAGDSLLVAYVRDITARKTAEQEIHEARDALTAANAQLEIDVARRTSELQATVKELEAFSYAVAHDLRAPLRGIAGFTEILWEDYGQLFDAQAREYFDRLLASTNRMAVLIDDLLNLSRVTRDEFTRETVDLSEAARSVVASLRRNEPEREIAVRIEKDIQAEGDPRLLGIMLENLIGNAWKFTAGKADARIEFCRRQTEDGPVISVSDNGAGFDMRYAHKLFTPFQRLHHITDFPGTGIGLATVQRIINRHGGRIWAEAEIDKGATFFFSLRPA